MSLSQTTRNLLNKHGFRIKKSLGQNFLIDPVALARITDAAGILKGDTVVEVGMGTGLLTKELAKTAKQVIAFEIDEKVIPIAKEYLGMDDEEARLIAPLSNIHIFQEDFLEADIRKILSGYRDTLATGHWSPTTKVVANVPYYITSPIIEKILENKDLFSTVVLTVQREFAERMTARPGTKQYGSFTIFTNYHTEPEIVANISRSSFIPHPEVGSSIIKLAIRPRPKITLRDEKLFFELVRAAFNQRRKTLRNALSAKLDIDNVDEALWETGIDPKRRGETLSIEEFAALSNNYRAGP